MLLLTAWLVAALPAASASPAPWAEGTLTVNGETLPLSHAYLSKPSTFEVHLTASPVDAAILKRIERRGDLQGSGLTYLVSVRIDGEGRPTSVGIRHPRFPEILNIDHPEDVSLASFDASRAEGSVATRAPRKARGVRVEYSIRFRAAPAPAGPIRSLDDLLDRWSGSRGILDAANDLFSRSIGALVLSCFGALVVTLLLWALVFAPRRAARLLKTFEAQGYLATTVKDPALNLALEGLGPFSLEGPARLDFEEEPPVVTHAVARSLRRGTRYVVHAQQRHQTIGHRSRWNTLWRSFVLESRPVRVDLELYVRPRGRELLRLNTPGAREARFGLAETTLAGADPAFVRLYSVFSPGGRPVTLPPEVARVFVDLEPLLVLPESIAETLRLKEHLQWANTKFCAEGWGITASNVWLDAAALRSLIEAADRLSEAVDAWG